MFDPNFHPESISPNLGPHDLVTCRESGKQGLGLLTTSVIAWTCHIKPECWNQNKCALSRPIESTFLQGCGRGVPALRIVIVWEKGAHGVGHISNRASPEPSITS